MIILVCLGQQTLLDRASRIRENTTFSKAVGQAISYRFEEKESSPHIEERLYDGFYSRSDEDLAKTFHASDWTGRYNLSKQFTDDRLSQLARRIIYLESPAALPANIFEKMDAAMTQRLNTEEDVPWQTIHSVQQEILDLREGASSESVAILDDYEICLQQFL